MEEYVKLKKEEYDRMVEEYRALTIEYNKITDALASNDKVIELDFRRWNSSWIYAKDETIEELILKLKQCQESFKNQRKEFQNYKEKMKRKWYFLWLY